MIVITGAAGFIGSVLVRKLNEERFFDLVLVDDFTKKEKSSNYLTKKYSKLIDRKDLIPWIHENHRLIQFVFHLGARTDTTEFNKAVFDELNLNYSKELWKTCVQCGLPLVYASSAATYGMGENGYDDSDELVQLLKPLNPYGESKNDFDKWVLAQEEQPFFWAGLKFFNVYGPNEYHKGRMASVIFHTFRQVKETGQMKLFRSHNPGYRDGEQMRDFIYVKDVAEVLYFMLHHRRNSGIYNLGTGQARTFLDLAKATFRALHQEEKIEFIDTPADIRDKYQYFTEAAMKKLRNAGYTVSFRTLEEGIADYVVNYLSLGAYY
jgi:ADP-L-glycero-D-manno-heptose 6-epimerase